MKFSKVCQHIAVLLCVFCGMLSLMSYTKAADRRVIKIGTTGDYRPITWKDGQDYHGFDIDIAQAMSKTLYVNVEFVETTWKTLSSDLMSGKFDIAMSGISITAEREQAFVFSKPILIDQKVAIIRCADKDKLKSFDDINQKNVRLIENIGGTNEICAKQYVKNANLILVDDNKIVFSEILENNADAMITDGIEAEYYNQKHPNTFCVVDISAQCPCISKKAYMLRKEDVSLKNELDLFIDKIRQDSTLLHMKKKWLIP